MLRILRQGQRWLMAAVIVLVGGVFVLYLGVGGPPGGGGLGGFWVVEVGDRHYGPRDLQRVRESQEQQYRDALGEAFDASQLGEQLDAAAAGALVQVAVLASEAERLGLRVTDSEVRRSVGRIPGARDEQGRLRAEDLRSFAESQYGSEQRFVEWERDRLLANKLLGLIDAGVAVSPAEARDAVRQRLEEIRIAYVVLPLDQARDPVAIEEAEIEALVAADPERVRAFYDQNLEEYQAPERVRARHVLLRVEADATPEQEQEVRERAAELLNRVREGADFGELAMELSEDPGSKSRGGDLGFFRRGQMAPAFEEAAFALAPGETSDLVRTPFGFHVIRLEERKPAEERSFEEVKREIARKLLEEDAARARTRATAERIAEAVRNGSSLVDAARAEELSIERPDWIRRRRDGLVPGLGRAPELLATAFALSGEAPSSPRIFEHADRLVLVQRLERRAPGAEEVEAEMAAERTRLEQQRRDAARSVWLQSAQRRLSEAGELRVDLSPLRGS